MRDSVLAFPAIVVHLALTSAKNSLMTLMFLVRNIVASEDWTDLGDASGGAVRRPRRAGGFAFASLYRPVLITDSGAHPAMTLLSGKNLMECRLLQRM